jgi:hypothetical protein
MQLYWVGLGIKKVGCGLDLMLIGIEVLIRNQVYYSGGLKSPMNISMNYLLHTYIVTSKPKRISVALGVVHIMILLSLRFISIIRLVTLRRSG